MAPGPTPPTRMRETGWSQFQTSPGRGPCSGSAQAGERREGDGLGASPSAGLGEEGGGASFWRSPGSHGNIPEPQIARPNVLRKT